MRGTLARVLGLETHSDLESETMDTEMGWKGELSLLTAGEKMQIIPKFKKAL